MEKDKEQPWYKTHSMRNTLSVIGHALANSLFVAAKSLGWPAFLATGASITAGLIARDRFVINREEKKLLGFYGDKIATLLHKNPSQLTMDDLYKAARSKEEGGLGITTLKRQVDKFEKFRTIKTLGRLASLAVIAGGVIAASVYAPWMLEGFAALSIMASAATVISKTAEGITDAMIERKDEGRVTRLVMGIDNEVKQAPVSPVRTLDVFVKARPELQKSISMRYGDYDQLVAYKKMQVVKDLEPTLHLAALTDAINKGAIKPNLLGLIAYNDNFEELPDYKRYQALCAMPPAQPQAEPPAGPAQHVEKLLAEKQEPALPRTLH